MSICTHTPQERAKHVPCCLCQVEQLRGELSLAEEGLANYAQENERMRDALLAIHGSTGPDGLWENKALHGVATNGLHPPQPREHT